MTYMLRRKIDDILLEWKESEDRKPLVIKGCRQCGKTSSVVAFAKKHYPHVVYLDFHEHREYKAFFAGALDVDTITFNMTLNLPNSRFVEGKTVLIFDEIQDCPSARSSLKYFKLDGRYDVICTGSLLDVNGYRTAEELEEEQNASIPVGFEEIIEMYPLDFEEWLWANDVQQQHVDYLKQCLEQEIPVNLSVHQRMRELLLRYVIVGGMPEVVTTYLKTNDMQRVIKRQHSIIETYKSDMIKYARNEDKVRIRECFDSIPAQLARENKKFVYSVIQPNARAKQYRGSLQWIEDAGIIRRCYNLHITELPLIGNADMNTFKVYMADIGLLINMLDEGVQWKILQGDLLGYKGAIFESLMADILGKIGRKLYYFHKSSGLELDFVIPYKGKCTPLECKATTGNTKSLKTVLKHPEHYHVYHALKVGDYNVGRNGPILTIPFYMAFMLTEM